MELYILPGVALCIRDGVPLLISPEGDTQRPPNTGGGVTFFEPEFGPTIELPKKRKDEVLLLMH